MRTTEAAAPGRWPERALEARPPLGAEYTALGTALLLDVLVWAAAGEFLFLRVFLRLGPVLPVREPLLPVYAAVETIGLAALNLAFLLAAALAVLLAARSLMPAPLGVSGGTRQRRQPVQPLFPVLVLAAVAANVGLGPAQSAMPIGAAAAQTGLSAAALVAVALTLLASNRRPGRQRPGQLALVLIVGAQSLALYYSLAQAVAARGVSFPGGGSALLAAEGLALAAALALPWSYRPPWRRRHLALGGLLGAILLGGLGARPWIAATLAMWTISFSLSWPNALYPVALASAAATVWALYQSGSVGRTAGRGLVLVLLAGLKLDFTYFALLALAGVLVLREPGAAVNSTGQEQAPQPRPDR